MFDIVLKNVILMVLVVLICHFLIQSKLLDMALPVSMPLPGAPTGPAAALTPPAAIPAVAPQPREAQLRELYEFVFAENAKGQLDTYFETPAMAPSSPSAMPSATRDCADPYNVMTKELCASSIESHLRERTKTLTATPRQTGQLEVIAEYEKESELNGGLLDGKQLKGFSTFTDDFAPIDG